MAYRLHNLTEDPRRIEPPPPTNHAISTAVTAGSSIALLSSVIAAVYLRSKKQEYQSKSLEHKKAKIFWAGVMRRLDGQSDNDLKQIVAQPFTAFYEGQEFSTKAAQRLTDKISGKRLSEETLKEALISLNQASHIVRMDQKGIFLLNSPNGHIYYARLDGGVVQIKVVIPRRGHEAELTGILSSIASKSSSNGRSPLKEGLTDVVR